MKVYVYLFLLGYLQCYAAHDIEIQAAMNLMPKFLRGIQTGAAYVSKLIRMKMQADAERQIKAQSNPNGISFRADGEKALEDKVITDLSSRASHYLETFAANMKKQLGSHKDYMHYLKKCQRDFSKNVEAYKSYVQEIEPPEDKIEQEMLLLDIVDTLNILIRTQQKRLFIDYIGSANDNTFSNSIPIVTTRMSKDLLNLKKENFKYLCKEKHVCKIYPAFSDRLAELLSEFIKLTEKRYKVFILTFVKLLKKQEIFPLIMDKQLYKDISESLDKVKHNEEMSREWITLIRSIIVQRHKSIFGDIDRDLKVRTQAIRIIFDIIDKVFYLDNAADVAHIFASEEDALKAWSNGIRNDLETILDTFLGYCDRKLKVAWEVFDIKDEVKTLIDVMQNGETVNNTIILNRLFREGTVFTKNESIENDTTSKDTKLPNDNENNINIEEYLKSNNTPDYSNS